jgi:hypothetical protein
MRDFRASFSGHPSKEVGAVPACCHKDHFQLAFPSGFLESRSALKVPLPRAMAVDQHLTDLSDSENWRAYSGNRRWA